MGLNIKPVRRLHKLRTDVSDNVPGYEKAEKLDKTLNSSPGSYKVTRGIRRRLEESFGADSLEKDKPKVAWEVDAALDRFDFGAGSFGIRITLPSSSQLSDRGLKAGDEVRILEKSSALKGKRYKAVSEANSGNVAAGKVRIVSNTVLRLPDGISTPAAQAQGFISLTLDMTGANLIDGETITLDDGVNPATVLEFDDDASVAPGNIAVTFTAGDSATVIKASLLAAINGVGAGLAITASDADDGVSKKLRLLNDATGTAGNQAILETVASTKLSVSGMSGGAAASTSFTTESSDRIRVEINAGSRR